MSPRTGRVAKQQQRRRRREQLGGSVVAAIGIVVAVVAVLALNNPRDHSTAAGTVTHTVTAPASSTSASPTTTAGGSTSGSASSSASSSTTTPASGSSSPDTSGKLPLVVLNNTTITHLAEQAAARFEAGGWTVTKYANYTNDIISTCAYYDPSVSGAEAAAEALQQQFPAIVRVEPQFSGLSAYASPIVVILTPDYAG